MTLFEECIEKLGASVEIFDLEQSKQLRSILFDRFQFASTSMDWDAYPNAVSIQSPNELIALLKNQDCYVFWDEFNSPVIKSETYRILNHLDDVLALSFDTWMLGTDFNWIVEFHHEGEIKFAPKTKDY